MTRYRLVPAMLMAAVLPAAFAAPPAKTPAAQHASTSANASMSTDTSTSMDEPEERGSHAMHQDSADSTTSGQANAITHERGNAQAGTKGQGGEMAADHSIAARRALWTQLDVDKDGRISAAEGQVDTDFNTSFPTLDIDHDGFLSDSEYLTYHQKQSPAMTDATRKKTRK